MAGNADDLILRESISLSESGINPDGTITLDLIRPCIGKGKGTHLYEADMLSKHAGVFNGWKMYVDHLSDAARRQLGGLPRSVRDLGGRITETWWNPDVPADPANGYGKGAVQGKAKPTPFIRELVENDPEIVRLSINGNATSVRPVVRDGKRALLVEGIQPNGSVDWVTEAGAGGKVVSLMEAAYATDEDAEAALLESMTDEELREYVNRVRPALAALLEGGAGEGDGTEGDGTEGDGAGTGDGGTTPPPDTSTEEEDVPPTPEAIREALSTDEGKAVLLDVLRESADDLLTPLVESRLDNERAIMQATAEATANRQIELRDLRDAAHGLIEAAKLPEKFAAQSKSKFDLVDGEPTEALDVIPEVDDDGNVTKTASAVLTEAVNSEIASQRELVSDLRPTRVRNQGASQGGDGEGAGEGAAKPDTVGPLTRSMLQEADATGAFSDPDTVYAHSA
jgi:hypothetical protein